MHLMNQEWFEERALILQTDADGTRYIQSLYRMSGSFRNSASKPGGRIGKGSSAQSSPEKMPADAVLDMGSVEKFTVDGTFEPPIDHNGSVYKIFFLQGLGMLFPWNIYITAQSYFAHRLQDTPESSTFLFWFSTLFQVANILGLGIAVYYGHKFNMRFSVAIPMIINAVVLVGTTALVRMDAVEHQMVFLITCASVMICGICTALLQLGIFGLAGRFPNVYMQAVMSGQGMSGISVALISLFSTLAEPASSSNLSYNDVKESAFFYFLVATIVIIATLLAFNLMTHLDFAQFYAFADTQWEEPRPRKKKQPKKKREMRAKRIKYEEQALVDSQPLLLRLGGVEEDTPVQKRRSIMESPVFSRRSTPSETPQESPENSPYSSSRGSNLSPGNDHGSEQQVSKWKLLGYIWRDGVAVFFVFFLTLSIFPAVTSKIRSVNNPEGIPLPKAGRFYGDLWIPFSFLCFNVGDTLGRVGAAYVKLSTEVTLGASLVRLIFVPLILNCSFSADTTPYFNNDVYPIAFVLTMAMSNGFLASCAMMNAPGNAPACAASKAGTWMAFFLELGLVSGCSFSYVYIAIL